MQLTIQENIELLQLLEQEERERVAPKLEIFRHPMRIKGCRGGRGAGAKSWSLVSLITQKAHRKPIRVVCLREIQNSLEESVHHLFCTTITRLGYPGWKITDRYIDSPCGSHIIFRGLKDLRASRQMKGYEGFDIFFIEEAAAISMESLNLLLPTIVRKDNSELWFAYNPEEDPDPITERIWNRKRDDAILIELEPGAKDNPWWNEGLQKEMELDFDYDADLAQHIWLGMPRSQGQKSVLRRVDIRAAMDRKLEYNPKEKDQIGIDVARFGDDRTVMYRRKGMKIIAEKILIKKDTQEVARTAWDLGDRKQFIPFVVDDTGVGGGVSDKLKDLGAKVIRVNFGNTATDQTKYTTVADEMWFEFPIHEADIPDDSELMRELSSRQYSYTKKDQRKIEPKDEFKKRVGRSPDKADALILTYYRGASLQISKESKNELAQRRKAR